MKLSAAFPTTEFDDEVPEVEIQFEHERNVMDWRVTKHVTGYILTYTKSFNLSPEQFKKVVAAGE